MTLTRSRAQLHHDRGVFEALNVRHVGMGERRQHLRFATEAREAIGIVHNRGQQDLDGDVAIQIRVACAKVRTTPTAPSPAAAP